MPTYAKALATFILQLLGGLAVVLSGPASSFGDVTDGQWVALAASSVAAGLAVYGIRNGVSPDPTTSTPELKPRKLDTGYGAFDLLVIVAVVLLIVVLVLILAGRM